MPEDRVTITADGSQYFDVLRRAGVAADRFAGSGDRIGAGFVRGERVIRTASANIAGALTMSGDAATTAIVAMQGLERVFAIGIGPTIAVAAGVKAFEVLHEGIKKTNDAYKDLKDELSKPLIPDAVTAAADQKIDELTKKIKALQEASQGKKSTIGGNLLGLLGIASNALLPSFLSRAITPVLAGSAPEGSASIKPVLDAAGKRLDAFAAQRGEAILRAADTLHQALVEAAGRFRTSTGNLFRDIGSGQFAKDLQQRNFENVQTKHGQEIAEFVREKVKEGLPLNELEAAVFNATGGAAGKGGVSVEDILHADFSNLDVLSKYDFSGLAPLSGLTLIVK